MESRAIHCSRDIKGRARVGGWGGKDECSRDMLSVRSCGIARTEFELVPIDVAGWLLKEQNTSILLVKNWCPEKSLIRVPLSLSCLV